MPAEVFPVAPLKTHTAFSLSDMCRKGFVFETHVLCSLFQVCVCWGAGGANFSE